MKLLFVCLGNICRSPTAEAVAKKRLAEKRITHITCDSAGTGDWHIGHAPDQRSQEAGKERGYDLSDLRARQLVADDFNEFDLIVVMDNSNLQNAQRLQPANSHAKLVRLLDYLPDQPLREVPDPYYGGEEGFYHVIDLIEQGVSQLIEDVAR